MGSGSLEEIKASGKLVILTRNAPTTYYFDTDEQGTGPEYDMIESFASSLGVQTEYKLFSTTGEILKALNLCGTSYNSSYIFEQTKVPLQHRLE